MQPKDYLNLPKNLKSTSKKEVKKDEWRELPLEKRIEHSLVKGLPEFVDEDMAEAVEKIFSGTEHHRRPADGRNERSWRPVWIRENVPATGN